MEDPYRKDLTHLTWAEVYARQEKRAPLVGPWIDALGLKPGDRVLDVGAGPGFVSMMLADRVGHTGIVYAVDRSADALAYLERLRKERDVPQIRCIVADGAALDAPNLSIDAALVTMMLHHAEDPIGILHRLAQLLPPGGSAVLAEFLPEGSPEQGPPKDHRISPEKLQSWCKEAGLAVLDTHHQSENHYMVTVRRPA